MLRYFYTDNVEKIKDYEIDSLIDLLICAEEYQVTRLKVRSVLRLV
jgi:hypothetical protein